ncbi:MAG: hypothetical protein U0P45_04175 [Acidimicrobiales bacterium]
MVVGAHDLAPGPHGLQPGEDPSQDAVDLLGRYRPIVAHPHDVVPVEGLDGISEVAADAHLVAALEVGHVEAVGDLDDPAVAVANDLWSHPFERHRGTVSAQAVGELLALVANLVEG